MALHPYFLLILQAACQGSLFLYFIRSLPEKQYKLSHSRRHQQKFCLQKRTALPYNIGADTGETTAKAPVSRIRSRVIEGGVIPLYDDENQGIQEPDLDHDNTDFDDDEPDIIEGVDEDGNKVLMQVMDYFFYNGEEYAVLTDAQEDEDEACEGCSLDTCQEHDHEEELDLYILKVVPSTNEDGEEMEEFVPVDEELMDTLVEIVQTNFLSEVDEEDDDEEDGEEEDDEDD
jgi:hypothetical protein